MKRFSKFIGIFMSIVLVLTLIPITGRSAFAAYYTDTFDLSRAQEYASQWSYSVNYDKYVKQSADCCNFVSQILIEGGIPETEYFHCSKDYASWQTNSTYNIPSLIQYFRSMYDIPYYNNTGSLYIGTVSADDYMRGSNDYDGVVINACDGHSFSINDIAAGDCVTISTGGSFGRDHIVYVLSVEYDTGLIHFSAHNRNARCRTATTKY